MYHGLQAPRVLKKYGEIPQKFGEHFNAAKFHKAESTNSLPRKIRGAPQENKPPGEAVTHVITGLEANLPELPMFFRTPMDTIFFESAYEDKTDWKFIAHRPRQKPPGQSKSVPSGN